MSRFSSPAVALAYFLLAGMGVVALLVAAGRVDEALVRRFVIPPLLVALAVAGLWEYQRLLGESDGNEVTPTDTGATDTDDA